MSHISDETGPTIAIDPSTPSFRCHDDRSPKKAILVSCDDVLEVWIVCEHHARVIRHLSNVRFLGRQDA